MSRMVWAELRKLWRSTPVRIAVALLICFVGLSYWQTAQNVKRGLWAPDLLAPAGSVTYTLALLATVGTMLIMVVGVWCCGQEFRFRTWPELLTHGASRGQIWLAKVVSVLTTVLLCILLSLAAGHVSSMLALGHSGLPHVDMRTVGQFVTVYFQMTFWAMAALTASLLMRGTGMAIAATLGFTMLEMLFWGSSFRFWLPVWNQRAVNGAAFGTGPMGMVTFFAHPDYPPVGQAVLVLSLVLCMLMLTSYALLRRSDWLA